MEVYDQSSCFFKDILETCNPSKRFDSKVLSATQQSTILRCSQERQDNFIASFTEGVKYNYHKDCHAEYTSKQKIDRYLRKRKLEESGPSDLSSPSQKRLRRYASFDLYDVRKSRRA